MERHGAAPSQISSPDYRTRPETIVSLKVAYTSIYDDFGTMENADTNPYLRIAVTGATEYVGRTLPAEGHSSWLPPTLSGVANRRRRVWMRMALYGCKTRPRAGEHALKRSSPRKWPTPTSTTILARRNAIFRIKLLPNMKLRTRTCVSP